MKKALILNYHLIDNNKYDFDAFGGIYAVNQSAFEEQMQILKKHNIKVATLRDIIQNQVDSDFCVALSFDDGNPSDFEVVYPILKEFGFKATFFLSIHNMGEKITEWGFYREMIKDGHSIGSHGLSHSDLTRLNRNDRLNEFSLSKSIIETNTNHPVSYFSLPFGMYNKDVIEDAKESGYQAIFSTRFKLFSVNEKSFVIDRWSIKAKTSIVDFEKIVTGNFIKTQEYTLLSKIKKTVIWGVGNPLINTLNTFKNKNL